MEISSRTSSSDVAIPLKNDGDDSRNSPTTVIEVVDCSGTNKFPVPDRPVDDDNVTVAFASVHNLYISTNSPSNYNKEDRYVKPRKKRKDRKKYHMCILPTIQEVSKEEEEEGEDETLGFVLSPLEDDISSHLRAISLPSNGDVGFKEVHLLIDAAKQRATQGNEEKAIEIYKDGVNILEQEVKRILKQMEESVTSKPKFEKTALYIVLHEEWAEAAGLMADIRTMMSTLYERQEEYDKAICCCEEAKSIYERQAIFDERHHKKGSTARDKEASMENMMEAIDEARETQGIRQSMHETVERIQTKLEATKDETSRGFLYEDIFDKLSTVLSLELMYLGEMHPQIANTKVLLSMYYIEIGQNDKALRTMNDAILICEIGLGDSHPKTGTKYHEAAKLYERIGGEENVLKSIDLYEKAIATLEKAEGDHSETLASILNSVGALYIKQTKYDVAVERLKDAILVIAKDNGDKSDDFSTEHVQLWLNLAECHSLRKEASLSINALRNAARVQRDKRKKYDALEKDVGNLPDLLTNTGISLTLRRLGTSLAAELKFDDATDCFLEALSLVKADLDTVKELAKFDPNIDLPLHQDEVASVLYDLAKVKQEDDKYDEALKLYRESLHLRKESDSDKAVDKRSNRVACAMCLAGMGSINLLQNKPDEAFKRFNQAIYYIKQEGIPDSHSIARMLWQKSHIAASDMKRVKIQSEKSTSNEIKLTTITQLEEQAEAFRKGRDYVKCMKTLDTVIGMKRDCLKRAEEEKKRVENARCQLAVSLIAMGDTMLITNAKKKSADCLTEAYGLLKSSGVPANNKHFRRIEKIRRSIRKMKERSETMAEF